jgi:hypothetical protein
MRLANHDGRLVVVQGDRYADVEHHTGGRFSAEPAAVFARWDDSWPTPLNGFHGSRPGML